MKKLSYLFLFLFTINSYSSWAWGTIGHRVIAEIAENHLNRKAKKNIAKIIGSQKLAYWANWADFIKSDPCWDHANSWHYINLEASLSESDFNTVVNKSTDEFLYKKMLFFIEQLKNKDIPMQKKQEYLYFLVHMIGDAHQPLHLGRAEDLGGNRFNVSWFGKKTNLHVVWDTKLIDYTQYSYTEYAEVLDIHNKQYNKLMTKGSIIDWLYDSYLITECIYEDINPDDKLSYRYYFDNQENLEQLLLKGGLRLAKVLNEIFG